MKNMEEKCSDGIYSLKDFFFANTIFLLPIFFIFDVRRTVWFFQRRKVLSVCTLYLVQFLEQNFDLNIRFLLSKTETLLFCSANFILHTQNSCVQNRSCVEIEPENFVLRQHKFVLFLSQALVWWPIFPYKICLFATQKFQHRLDFNTSAISNTKVLRVWNYSFSLICDKQRWNRFQAKNKLDDLSFKMF
jgi:hypothetical protein